MDESLSNPTESKLPILIGGLAFVLAVLAVLFAWSTRNQAISANKLATELNSRMESPSDSAAKVAQLESRVAALENESRLLAQEQAEFKMKTDAGFQDAHVKLQSVVNLVNRLVQSGGSRGGNVGGGTTGGTTGGTSGAGTVVSGEYTVAAGDTLSGIARKAGVTLSALEAANPGVDSTRLRIGQKLKVPGR